jgi:hypothetical protein
LQDIYAFMKTLTNPNVKKPSLCNQKIAAVHLKIPLSVLRFCPALYNAKEVAPSPGPPKSMEILFTSRL